MTDYIKLEIEHIEKNYLHSNTTLRGDYKFKLPLFVEIKDNEFMGMAKLNHVFHCSMLLKKNHYDELNVEDKKRADIQYANMLLLRFALEEFRNFLNSEFWDRDYIREWQSALNEIISAEISLHKKTFLRPETAKDRMEDKTDVGLEELDALMETDVAEND